MLLKFDTVFELVQQRENEFCYQDANKVLFAEINYDHFRMQQNPEILKEFLADATYENALRLFHGGFFLVAIDKNTQKILVLRDKAGIKTGYYSKTKNGFYIGTNQHQVAKIAQIHDFDPVFCDMLVNINFVPDGHTVYSNVNEFLIGSCSSLNYQGEFLATKKYELKLATKENTLSEEENCKKLKESILNAHSVLTGKNNIVYLSGGIDSCVILAALKELVPVSSIHSVTFRVHGTHQDESPYAKSIAKSLNISNELRDIDVKTDKIYEDFENRIMSSNNPYFGMWLYAPQTDIEDSVWFAGQDTRLHTPALNQIDKIVFKIVTNKSLYALSSLTHWVDWLYQPIFQLLKLNMANSNVIRYSDHVAAMTNPQDYLQRYLFKLNPAKFKHNFSLACRNFDEIASYYPLDLKKISNPRQLYNEIVRVKWGEQYTDDIHYMQDMGNAYHTCVQMPFYDVDHAEFSSGIPFDLATKFFTGDSEFGGSTRKINKYVLRKAFSKELNAMVSKRAKAVSNNMALVFNGALRKIIKSIFENDLKSDISFVKRYKYEEMVDRFCSYDKDWDIEEYTYLLNTYYLAILCIYNRKLNN